MSDNGPPFNSYDFNVFLERQGIEVMKSPPYNPSSNGQAERLVRTVKEVLKRFLLEPEIMELDQEGQINLFLFNYRNNNMTRDGHFPSERIFSYAPKTILDLINPKKQYKHQLEGPQLNDDESITETIVGKIPKRTNDAVDDLTAGDDLWYKNHSTHNHARWIKASFIKKYSPNTFQISIGNVKTMAHRNQIRIRKDESTWQRPNVLITTGGRNAATNERLGDTYEVQEVCEGEGKVRSNRGRKRKQSDSEAEQKEPRRSKRNKKANRSDDYYYD